MQTSAIFGYTARMDIAALKQKYGTVYELKVKRPTGVELDTVVVRMPTPLEFRRWRGEMGMENKRLDAAENLLRPCIVWPEGPELDALLAGRPGLIASFTSGLLNLAGMYEEVEKKEL